MPICSYIVYPVEGKLKELKKKLISLDGCEIIPAINQDLLILLTDTHSSLEEADLQRNLKKINEIQSLALTFGDIV